MTMLLRKETARADLEPTPACEQPKKTRKRVVRFQQDSNGAVKEEILGPLLKPCSEMDDDEKRRIYWSKQDYVVFRSARHMLVNIVKERELVDKERSLPWNRAKSYVEILARVGYSCRGIDFDVEDDNDTETDLCNLGRHQMRTNSLRGLENHLVPEIYMQKKGRSNDVAF
eukprot:CAMPEP_0195289298 /NCGR_PEP_ID=MMETSP0707-20130614/5637_1 /TAXON_ID=33640 /ORGANISM="Asterionellopsis glacialis, Strain CCMP134" /LENGTH=170 /DNA_ID=CAMNT_0040349289 /DNA_START=55 /DNA_END=567 /DNA_ORIENTATION=+